MGSHGAALSEHPVRFREKELNGRSVYVHLGELRVSSHEGELLAAPALGSCVAVCLYDFEVRVGGMAHVLLPSSAEARAPHVGRYADTAVPGLLSLMERRGARRDRVRCAIAGGANVFVTLQHPKLRAIGDRNVEAVRLALERLSLPLQGHDTGGTKARTVVLDIATGQVTLTRPGEPARLLAALG